MCGIVGFFSPAKDYVPTLDQLEIALKTLNRRGPDARGVHYDLESGIGFAHARLAVLDLSQEGAQPMKSDRGAIAFNGEVYNFKALRSDLQLRGWNFKSQTDTEAVLALHDEGHTDVPAHLKGMFAYAYYSMREREIYIARDRAGEKPLFYALVKSTIIFGSTTKAVRALMPDSSLNIDAIRHFLTTDIFPENESVWNEIKKLPPGHELRYRAGLPEVQRYYRHKSEPVHFENSSETFEKLFSETVQSVSVADVPVGVFLSGGIDSTLVTHAMRKFSNDLHSFSVGYSEQSFDESKFAAQAARILKTHHHHTSLTSSQALEDLDLALSGLDEPLGDPSYLATWHVSRLARKYVTVALGGDGADELFMGYASMPLEKLGWLWSLPALKTPAFLHEIIRSMGPSDRYMSLSHKISQFAGGLGSPTELRHQKWIGAAAPAGVLNSQNRVMSGEKASGSHWDQMERFYFESYLPLSVLTKSDRASMAHGLEVRAPFLHPDILKFASALPRDQKLRLGETKWILRRALSRVPELASFASRKKHGFAIPLASWLKHPDWDEKIKAELKEASPFLSQILNVSALMKEAKHAKFVYNTFVLAHWINREAKL